jgi:hypothetical protein
MRAIILLLAITVNITTFADENLPYFETSDIFNTDYISYESDGIVPEDIPEHEREQAVEDFKHRCQTKVLLSKQESISRMAANYSQFFVGDITFSTKIVKSETIYGGLFLICKSEARVSKNSFFHIKPVYSQLFKGKKAKSQCDKYKKNIIEHGNKLNVFDKRYYISGKLRNNGSEKIDKCQVMTLNFVPSPDYTTAPSCTDGKYSITIEAKRLDENEIADFSHLPYNPIGDLLSLITLGDSTGEICESGKINEFAGSLCYGQKIVKNRQVGFKFELPNNFPVNQISKLLASTATINIYKLHESHRNDTEIICISDAQRCSGKIFKMGYFSRFINKDFFEKYEVPITSTWSRLMANSDSKKESEVEFKVNEIIGTEELFNIFKDNNKVNFIIADDVFVRKASLKLDFQCI